MTSDTRLTAEQLSAAMNDAYTYEDRDNAKPTLPFYDDVEAFWDPFAAKVIATLDAVPLDVLDAATPATGLDDPLRLAAVAVCNLWFTDNAPDNSQHVRKAMLALRDVLDATPATGPDATWGFINPETGDFIGVTEEGMRRRWGSARPAAVSGLDVERLYAAWTAHRNTGHHPESTSGCFPDNKDCLTAIATEYARLSEGTE